MRIGERIDRWLATRGHGVHSPLAFRIVEHVVHPSRDVVYYGEEKLQSLPDLHGRRLKRARLLLRLVAELRPAKVWTSPAIDASLVEAVRLAGEVIRLYDGKLYPRKLEESDMLVLDGKKLTREQLSHAVEREMGVAGFGLDPVWVSKLSSFMKGGVLLDAVGSFIMVNRKGEEKHVYKIGGF